MKKRNISILFWMLSLMLDSCDTQEPHYQQSSLKTNCIEVELKAEHKRLLRLALNTGDEMAYNEVAAYYLLHHAHHEFYFYALAMANRHQCAEAYYHLGYFLKSKTIIDSIDLTKPNSITDSLATYYFLKAYELGYESALYSLKDDFKMNRPSAKSYLAKLNQL